MNTAGSPIILVDHHTGFNIGSMTQKDKFHQNRVGEAWVAQNWFEALAPILPTASDFSINAGLNDAWYNKATDGQGFFVTVFPDIKQLSLAWFTYDTELPPGDASAMLGDPGHRWLTAIGPYSGDTANLTLYVTKGGLFDKGSPVPDSSEDGSIFQVLIKFIYNVGRQVLAMAGQLGLKLWPVLLNDLVE